MKCFQHQETRHIVYIDPAETILPYLYVKSVALERFRSSGFQVREEKIKDVVAAWQRSELKSAASQQQPEEPHGLHGRWTTSKGMRVTIDSTAVIWPNGKSW